MKASSFLTSLAQAIIAAALLALFCRTFVVQPFVVPSASMEQGLLVGDHILVNKMIYAQPPEGAWAWLLPHRRPERGDVVVFKFPENPRRDFLKRCLGLPGDRVELEDKALLINDQPLDEEAYLHDDDPTVYPRSLYLHEGHRNRDNYGPVYVPEGYYFCLGDHRNESRDSRFWGPVPASYIKGRAWMVYWSYPPPGPTVSREAPSNIWNRFAGALKDFAARTRWDRTFRVVR